MTTLAALLHQSKARDQRLAITSLPRALGLVAYGWWLTEEETNWDCRRVPREGPRGADHVHILSADCLEIHRDLKRTGSVALRSDYTNALRYESDCDALSYYDAPFLV
ncbi:hypothetical protein OIU84_004146 [Salix udensis]|uniref:Uncharacterized protein n=1 Tax=Salix udensis TaxID=889485 RepID=A0AAD6K3M2_9ROSI|nr:hypothetical protein OIU84_004146 [Salix udensis]